MKLRFYAREDQLVPVPGSFPRIGQAPSYIGRKFVAADRSHPATDDPYECDAETEGGRRLKKLTRRDACLWPADEATARACGVAFVPVEVKDGIAREKDSGSRASVRRTQTSAASAEGNG